MTRPSRRSRHEQRALFDRQMERVDRRQWLAHERGDHSAGYERDCARCQIAAWKANDFIEPPTGLPSWVPRLPRPEEE